MFDQVWWPLQDALDGAEAVQVVPCGALASLPFAALWDGQMHLVERLADRVLLMNAGRRVLYGTLAQIREEAQAAGKIILTLDPAAEITALESLEIVQRVERRGTGEYAFFLRKSEHLRSFLREAAAHTEILGVNTERTSLHDIFVQAVRAGGDSIPEESQ